MKTISVNNESYDRFKLAREKRPQDDNNAQTFEHILQFYEGKSILPLQKVEPKTLSQIIDAENAQKERALAPTKNNQFVKIGEIRLGVEKP